MLLMPAFQVGGIPPPTTGRPSKAAACSDLSRVHNVVQPGTDPDPIPVRANSKARKERVRGENQKKI